MASGHFSLDDKTALVTGGARGLGLACARALLEHGASVIITARRPDAADQAVRHLEGSGRCEAIVADLATSEGAADLGSRVAERHDGIDILVNNAGTNWGAPFPDYPPHAWSKVMQVNVASPFQVIQHTLGSLERRATAEDPSRIVNIGSIDGHSAGPYDNFAYAASKAALQHLTTILARRLAAHRITVNCVAPGPVRTDMTAALLERDGDAIAGSAPLGRLPQADEVGAAVVYLAAPAAASITGCTVPVDGGLAINAWGRESQ